MEIVRNQSDPEGPVQELPITPEKDIEISNGHTVKMPFPDRGWDFSPSFHRGPRRRGPRTVVLWSWAAAGLDVLMIIGLSLMIAGITGFFFREQYLGLLVGDKLGIFSLVVMGFSCIYMLMLRSIMGASIGDLTYGLSLGTKKQRKKETFPLQVLWRFTVIMATGFVVLPFLSLLSGQDIAGRISGVKVYSLK